MALVVVDVALTLGRSQALDHAANALAAHGTGIDHLAHVEGRRDLDHRVLPGFRVYLRYHAVSAVGPVQGGEALPRLLVKAG